MVRRSFTRTNIQPNQHRSVTKKGDFTFFIVILGLSLWGVLMVYSGSVLVAVKQEQVPYYYALKQLTWVLVGIVAGYLAYRIDYHKIARLAMPMLGFSLALLIVVLLVNINNPIKRWIHLGWFDLQPSELVKVTFLIYLSTWLAKLKDRGIVKDKWLAFKEHLKRELGPFLLVLGVVCILIVIQPDMDTTIMLGMTSFIVYIISGTDFLHLIGSISTAFILGLVTTITTLSANYRISRLTNFIDFWRTGNVQDRYGSGFQLMQILVAVASGGLFGVGFGESRQKFYYLGDTAFSDTIFAIIAEEFGLLGCLAIISLFVFILLRGFKIAQQAPDKLGSLLVVSMVIWVTLQAFLHIGANVALIPINGNTLPFLSYGGSSTVVNLVAMGLVLNVSRHAIKQ